mmetsp:Transcript_11089/g.18327  ORF Transcript_11089/g.18327 Transcript_11089/m.18327 type:complete len:265 (-) Transcript_11089:4200-4994(-)
MLPWLPLIVIQPATPSLSERPLTRITPVSLSSIGPSSTSTTSPASILLTTWAVLPARLSWITVLAVHLYDGVQGFKFCVFNVTQPSAPSCVARPRILSTSSNFSSFGPSTTSTASPFDNILSVGAWSLENDFCNGVSTNKVYSLVFSSAYTVPAFPLIVIQPSSPSFRDRPCIRVTLELLFFPVDDSVSSTGPSKTKKVSFTFSFRRTLHALISFASVIAMPAVQVKYLPPFSAVIVPSFVLSVNHPSLPSWQALTLARLAASN